MNRIVPDSIVFDDVARIKQYPPTGTVVDTNELDPEVTETCEATVPMDMLLSRDTVTLVEDSLVTVTEEGYVAPEANGIDEGGVIGLLSNEGILALADDVGLAVMPALQLNGEVTLTTFEKGAS